MSSQAREAKAKINKQKICTVKDAIKERKKKQSTREDICKSYVRKGVNIQNISKNSQSLTTTAKKPTSFKKKY